MHEGSSESSSQVHIVKNCVELVRFCTKISLAFNCVFLHFEGPWYVSGVCLEFGQITRLTAKRNSLGIIPVGPL